MALYLLNAKWRYLIYSKNLELIEMVRKVNFLMKQYEKIQSDGATDSRSFFVMPTVEYYFKKKLYFYVKRNKL